MAIAFVQSAAADFYPSPISGNVTITGSTAGNLLIAGVSASYYGVASSVTDNAGNIYTSVPSLTSTDGTFGTSIWYCNNCLGGATIVTVTFSTAIGEGTMAVYEFSGQNTGSVVDSANTSTGSGTAAISATLTPSVTGELLIAYAVNGTSGITSVTSPWVLIIPSGSAAGSAYYLNPPISAQQATFNYPSGSSYATSIAAFLPPSSGPNPAVATSMFLVF